ncbi:hypothetical protein DF3PB_5070005 [uncultured Defluviicoccus sp.]|uniref:Uncharacterized protein n=1 Tax=metagenome TaxID=256318 RepID=A0A380THC3_9ZZZZ|nr:hypothetical protein DF3PB_5070005 [uncultured Defluviicoccus sp.]
MTVALVACARKLLIFANTVASRPALGGHPGPGAPFGTRSQ